MARHQGWQLGDGNGGCYGRTLLTAEACTLCSSSLRTGGAVLKSLQWNTFFWPITTEEPQDPDKG